MVPIANNSSGRAFLDVIGSSPRHVGPKLNKLVHFERAVVVFDNKGELGSPQRRTRERGFWGLPSLDSLSVVEIMLKVPLLRHLISLPIMI
jgi:hypothetical protein